MFEFDSSDELKKIIFVLNKKNSVLAEHLKKKMAEIINSNSETITHYKNLGNVMSDKKRAHIGKNFVLTFKVNIKENFILFVDFDHRGKIYD